MSINDDIFDYQYCNVNDLVPGMLIDFTRIKNEPSEIYLIISVDVVDDIITFRDKDTPIAGSIFINCIDSHGKEDTLIFVSDPSHQSFGVVRVIGMKDTNETV